MATAARNLDARRLEKRSVVLQGHATSVALEPSFWRALEDYAAAEGLSATRLIIAIDAERQGGSLASAIRVAVLKWALGRHGRGGTD